MPISSMLSTELSLNIKALADDVAADVLHEIGQQRHRLVGEEVAAVLGRIGDDHVHLVELFPGDGVGDQRHLVQALVVGRFLLDTGGDHGVEGQFNAGLDHGDHQDAVVEILLLADLGRGGDRFLESGLGGLGPPGQQVLVVVGPVDHHGAGEITGHDVVHVLLEQRGQDLLDLLGQVVRPNLGRVGEPVHHVGDAAVLEGLGDGLPAVLDQLGGVAGHRCPRSIILSKQSSEPAWSMPQRMVCSPMRSDLTSATKEDWRTPARSAPVPQA